MRLHRASARPLHARNVCAPRGAQKTHAIVRACCTSARKSKATSIDAESRALLTKLTRKCKHAVRPEYGSMRVRNRGTRYTRHLPRAVGCSAAYDRKMLMTSDETPGLA